MKIAIPWSKEIIFSGNSQRIGISLNKSGKVHWKKKKDALTETTWEFIGQDQLIYVHYSKFITYTSSRT